MHKKGESKQSYGKATLWMCNLVKSKRFLLIDNK